MSIEESRQYHEERERIVDCFVKELQFEPRNHKENINSEHRQHEILARFLEITNRLKDAYEDKSGIREREIKKMSSNEISEFYNRLTEIKEYHKRNPDENISLLSLEYDKYSKIRENPDEASAAIIDFTDEEGYGKFLDLHECYHIYLNLKTVQTADYVTYLNSFDKLYDYPKDKKNVAYFNYLTKLHEYLEGFINRTKPMLEYTAIENRNRMSGEFNSEWEEGRFRGWLREPGSALLQSVTAHLDLSTFNSPKELESLGLDRLKSALSALNMKCGGTLEERAQRLWITKDKSIEELRNKMKNLFKKTSTGFMKGNAPISLKDDQKKMAWLEAQIYYTMEILEKERQETIENVQRKQARSLEELEEEDESEEEPEVVNEVGDTEENTTIYNPKNLPLDWDGKPIPYWLYKLHGLNMYFTCEICGNETYRGPKAFQQHFTEWRHAHGMRCLGVPNMPAFANITKIADAISLWTKINNNKAELQHRQDEEEYEDTQGNVISKRTYDDLKRQGLL